MKINYNPNTLAYYLQTLYGIVDDSANFEISYSDIQIIKHRHMKTFTPKSFRKTMQKRRKSNYKNRNQDDSE